MNNTKRHHKKFRERRDQCGAELYFSNMICYKSSDTAGWNSETLYFHSSNKIPREANSACLTGPWTIL